MTDEDDDGSTTLCDVCGREVDETLTETCKCGEQVCHDCRDDHEKECNP